MGYERYPRGTDPQRDYYGRREQQDYGQDYGSGRSYSYSSARNYSASGAFDRHDDDRNERGGYGRSEYGNAGYGRSGSQYRSDDDRGGDRASSYGTSGYGAGDFDRQGFGGQDQGRSDFGRSDYGRSDYGRSSSMDRGNRDAGQRDYGQSREYHGSYMHDGRRFEDVGSRRHWDDDNYRGDNYRGRNQQQSQQRGGGYGRQPQGYDYDDRGFLARAGDEVRSWFGDEDAERRREMDSRYDERYYNQQGHSDRDGDYHNWRSGQIRALDRDYDEYRQENRSKFENEFSSWRSNRQTQRASLDKVKEHAEVLGSDGTHVGTVDKVRGDRIILTKNDADAGGRHHSIPSSWLQSVDDGKVTLVKTADEAKRHWRDEEQNQAMFRHGDDAGRNSWGSDQSNTGQDRSTTTGTSSSTTNLNRSFSGTYDDKKA